MNRRPERGSTPRYGIERKRIDTETSAEILQSAEQKAEVVNQEKMLDITTFEDLYGKENVDRDRRFVEVREAQFNAAEDRETANNRWATIAETLVWDACKSHGWLGERTTTLPTSRYDDIAHGVDMLTETTWPNSAVSRLACAIDVSTGANFMSKKFDKMAQGIMNGELGRARYVVSQRHGFRGELTQLPKLVIGLDQEAVKGLSRAWTENPEQLNGAFTQYRLLEQMFMQANAMRKIMTRSHVNISEEQKRNMQSAYMDAGYVLNTILKEKKRQLFDSGFSEERYGREIENDKVHRAIYYNLQHMQQQFRRPPSVRTT